MMSTGAAAVLQNPYALQAGYQGVQVPQFPLPIYANEASRCWNENAWHFLLQLRYL